MELNKEKNKIIKVHIVSCLIEIIFIILLTFIAVKLDAGAVGFMPLISFTAVVIGESVSCIESIKYER